MRVAVTGATGQLGYDVCARLERLGMEPIRLAYPAFDLADSQGARQAEAQFAALLGRPLPAAPKPGRPYTSASTMGDVRRTVVGHAMTFVLHREAKKMRAAGDAGMAAMMETTAYESPLRSLRMFTNGQLRYRQIAGIVAMANRHFAHGLRLFFGKSRPHG